MSKLIAFLSTTAMALALATVLPARPPEPPEPPKAKKKAEEGPAGDLRKAYDLLRRLRADHRAVGRPEERLRDWTERSVKLYRDGVRAYEAGDERLAHEYGAAAHDLGRAIDHARNASLDDGPSTDLPLPPGAGTEGSDAHVRAELRRAYDRIRRGTEDWSSPATQFYNDGARDLYNAARNDAAAGRLDRAGELAKAAEAITHVSEHLTHASEGTERPAGKRERDEPRPGPGVFDRGPGAGPDRELPPPL